MIRRIGRKLSDGTSAENSIVCTFFMIPYKMLLLLWRYLHFFLNQRRIGNPFVLKSFMIIRRINWKEKMMKRASKLTKSTWVCWVLERMPDYTRQMYGITHRYQWLSPMLREATRTREWALRGILLISYPTTHFSCTTLISIKMTFSWYVWWWG